MRGHELSYHVAVTAVDFDTVEAGFLGANRSVAVRVYKLPALVAGQLAADGVVSGAGDCGGGDGSLAADENGEGLTAAVVELTEDRAARSVDGVGELFPAGDERIVPDAGFEDDGLAVGLNGDDLGDYKSVAALCAGGVIGDELIGDVAVRGGEVRAHGGDDEAVLQLDAADLYRLEQFFQIHV